MKSLKTIIATTAIGCLGGSIYLSSTSPHQPPEIIQEWVLRNELEKLSRPYESYNSRVQYIREQLKILEEENREDRNRIDLRNWLEWGLLMLGTVGAAYVILSSESRKQEDKK